MVRTAAAILVLFSVLCSSLYAQSSLRLYWIGASGGAAVTTNFKADTSLFQRLSSEDDSLLHPVLQGFTQRDYYSINAGADVSLACAFYIGSGKSNPWRRQLRFGLHYSTRRFVSARYRDETSKRFDTVYIETEPYYYDSVFRYEYNYRCRTSQAGVSASLLFATDTSKLIGFYGGLSLSQFFSVSSSVHAEYISRVQTERSNASGEVTDIPDNEKQTLQRTRTELKGRQAYITRIGIPAGVTLRLSRKLPVLKSLQLFAEVQPFFELNAFSGAGVFYNAGGYWNAGLRYLFL